MLLGDLALDALGEQRLGVGGPRIGAGAREVEVLLVLERLRGGAVVGPVGMELAETAGRSRGPRSARRGRPRPRRQVGRGQHGDRGRRDDLHELDAHVPALVAPRAARVPRDLLLLEALPRGRCRRPGSGALDGLDGVSAGLARWASSSRSSQGPPLHVLVPFHVAPRRCRCPKVRLEQDFVSGGTILSRFGPQKRDRSVIRPATALARRR